MTMTAAIQLSHQSDIQESFGALSPKPQNLIDFEP